MSGEAFSFSALAYGAQRCTVPVVDGASTRDGGARQCARRTRIEIDDYGPICRQHADMAVAGRIFLSLRYGFGGVPMTREEALREVGWVAREAREMVDAMPPEDAPAEIRAAWQQRRDEFYARKAALLAFIQADKEVSRLTTKAKTVDELHGEYVAAVEAVRVAKAALTGRRVEWWPFGHEPDDATENGPTIGVVRDVTLGGVKVKWTSSRRHFAADAMHPGDLRFAR